MMHNLRNHLGRCLLGLLLLFVASRGMRLPRETNSVWQHGKDASYEILRQLEKLDIKEPEAEHTQSPKSFLTGYGFQTFGRPVLDTFQLDNLDQVHLTDVFNTTVQFPQPIECSDSCDPDSLATTNKTHCLTKISKGLQDYHNLLVMFDDSEVMTTTKLQKALNSLLQLPLLKDGSNKESRSPVTKTSVPAWQKGPLQNLTLWRLQSFGVVVARVFSHCASLF